MISKETLTFLSPSNPVLQYFIVLYCIILYCIVFFCIVLVGLAALQDWLVAKFRPVTACSHITMSVSRKIRMEAPRISTLESLLLVSRSCLLIQLLVRAPVCGVVNLTGLCCRDIDADSYSDQLVIHGCTAGTHSDSIWQTSKGEPVLQCKSLTSYCFIAIIIVRLINL